MPSIASAAENLSVLDYLQRSVAGTLSDAHTTHMHYPTAISATLGMRVIAVGEGTATLSIDADAAVHGNQQGTVHGGLIAELADAAFGTAHSTRMLPGESFTSIELKLNFIRPVWRSTLRASASPIHAGRTISHYRCDIVDEAGRLIATALTTVMTLRGEQAKGR